MGDHPHAGAPQSADTGLGAARLSDPADGGREGGRYQPMFAGAGARRRAYARAHPIVSLVAGRTGQGIITLFLVSLVVFAATQLLPGNAARAILGFSATPQRIRALELELGLNRGWWSQYWGLSLIHILMCELTGEFPKCEACAGTGSVNAADTLDIGKRYARCSSCEGSGKALAI